MPGKTRMIRIRRSDERGRFDHGWLDTRHTFSFAEYHDPAYMGFRALRVLNEDRVAPAQGFGMHGHRDMEILSYVLAGRLEHRDSMGNGSVLEPGDVQVMSAGTGVRHSEFNASSTEPVHFLQVWILPEQEGLRPRYGERRFPDDEKRGRLRLVASRDGRDGSVVVVQDVAVHGAVLEGGKRLEHPLAPGRHAWVQVLRGRVDLAGHALVAGDGAAVSDERVVWLAGDRAEVLLFDLA